MQQSQIERDLLGIRDRPPVIGGIVAAWKFTRRYPTLPMLILAILISIGIFAPVLAPHDSRAGGIRDRHLPPAWAVLDDGYTVKVGDRDHILGTDHAGRDVMSRLFFGARISLVVAAIALTSGFVVGTTMGITSGYAGGWWDEIVTRTVDIFAALPFLMMALVATMMFGQSLRLLLALMALLAWVPFVRVTRSQTLVIKNEPYVDLARVAGASLPRIILRHILPGVLSTAVVIATLSVGSLILAEAALSFLGAGVPSPTPTWGAMVQEGRNYLTTAWWPTFFPGVAIFMTVMSLNFTGDWLRDRLDPRLRQIMD
ncbi:MAG: ABC transporter permease [SAR202 cluster bacterium]|jgi:peptide/nickel transport system permease protein|nr:peptide ABC transporter permease [Chloroflexota bacterium]MDP6421832.1 ABC transporter permease [SAR202 cluster bacterium]HAL48389.1 peptide ABC transporter permease [Dehalococcoidia bacterium]MDP6663914.1 ABC transporter permease [SAR202 cluster bacterium]MDP6800268.1 ABC transporter permease [SAR202 cluster bacterium]|tara:strand:+ start:372 stop:1313 length:942 start_codon:yes stop_codon:yes gene_type:complete